MTVIEDTIVVATDRHFSFMVPETDLAEALALKEIPEGLLPDDSNYLDANGKPIVDPATGKLKTCCSLAGLKINEVKITNRRQQMHKGIRVAAVRVMFIHDSNPRSIVQIPARSVPRGGRAARAEAAAAHRAMLLKEAEAKAAAVAPEVKT